MAAGGPDISRLHSGRSRQDIGSTTQRLITRDDFLTAFEKLNGMRDALLALAAQAPNAILPAYTWGVQAQPITLGHYISAYANALDRQATRMREAYAQTQSVAARRGRAWAHRASRSTALVSPSCSASMRRSRTRSTPTRFRRSMAAPSLRGLRPRPR